MRREYIPSFMGGTLGQRLLWVNNKREHLTIFPLQYGEEQQGVVDGEGDAVIALVRVAAEDVLVFTNFLTLPLAGTLPGDLTSVRFYFLLKVKVVKVLVGELKLHAIFKI